MLIMASHGSDHNRHWVLLFGLGQIGSAIRDCLVNNEFDTIREFAFSWNDGQLQQSQIGSILKFISHQLDHDDSVSIVWSAGVCGFHSSQAHANEEFVSFKTVVELATTLCMDWSRLALDFHLVSSAGGLFEGQRVIQHDSKPTPLRVYGKLKSAQELHAIAELKTSSLIIYRPSSVYGPMVQDAHRGLINNLVKNARSGKTTVLDSELMSLRDYVYAGDVGNYIGQKIKHSKGILRRTRFYFLVSSRCSSIFGVVQKIQKILHLNVYYRLDDSFGNNCNITFHQNVMPLDWRPATLEYGIRQFAIVGN